MCKRLGYEVSAVLTVFVRTVIDIKARFPALRVQRKIQNTPIYRVCACVCVSLRKAGNCALTKLTRPLHTYLQLTDSITVCRPITVLHNFSIKMS